MVILQVQIGAESIMFVAVWTLSKQNSKGSEVKEKVA